jgi:hypothetical protein
MNIKRAAPWALAALFLTAAFFALRLAWADYLFRSGDAKAAARIVPYRADYQAAIGNWRRAVELNPYFSEGWNRLAMDAEAAGDFPEAERLLLRAAQVDQLFEPRWALANFYLRRDRKPDFVKWLRLAAERSYPDRTGLFRLAARMAAGPQEIAAEILPPIPELLADYVTFLTKEGDLTGAAAAADHLLPIAGPDQRKIILTLCDTLLAKKQGTAAHRVWRGFHKDSSGLLTNPELAIAPINQGFDWSLHWRAGIHATWTPRQIRIALSGKQPESVDLASQYVFLPQAGAYRFQYRYRTEGLARDSGVHWIAEGAENARTPRYLSGEDWQDGVLEFRTNAPDQLVRLTLMYQRAPGTVRQEGLVVIEGGMRLAPHSPGGKSAHVRRYGRVPKFVRHASSARFPLTRPHNSRVRSAIDHAIMRTSFPTPTASRFPSGVKNTDRASPASGMRATSRPVVSQTLTERSRPALAKCVPAGCAAT